MNRTQSRARRRVLPAAPIIALLKAYRLLVSPYLPRACRFEPSCSRYAMEALEAHGLIRGTLFTLRRILRCRPFGGWGYDPVPKARKR